MKTFGTLALTGFLSLIPAFSNSQTSTLLNDVKNYLNSDGSVQSKYRVGKDTVSFEDVQVKDFGRGYDVSFKVYIWRRYNLDGKEFSAFHLIGRESNPSQFGTENTIDELPSYYIFNGKDYTDEKADGINGNEKRTFRQNPSMFRKGD